MYAIYSGISKFLKAGTYDYCDIETTEDEYTLVTSDGALMTVLEVIGTYGIISENSFSEKLNLILSKLAGVLKKPGLNIDFVFTRDPDSSLREVSKSTKGSMSTLKRLGMELETMVEEREEVLSEKTSVERCYLVISSNSQILTQSAASAALEDRNKRVRKYGVGIKPGEFGQSPFVAIKAIKQSHLGFVDTIISGLAESTIIEKLEVHDAIKAIKMEISEEYTAEDWRPKLLGDKISPRLTSETPMKADTSHVQSPSISFQLFNSAPSVHPDDPTMVKMGSNVIAPILVDIPPQDPKAFIELFNTIPDTMPWRWSFRITTGHNEVIGKLGNKYTFASLLAFSSTQNRQIKESVEELLELANKGQVLVSANMQLCTWGKDTDEAQKRKALLTQSMQGWGSTDIIDERGDPIHAWLSTIPGLCKPISNTFAITLMEAIGLVPFNRPASPWKQGSLLFRTIDGKLYPFEAGSGKQTSWTDLVFAPPGYGKSFYLAAANMALILAAGNKNLPRIAIIDIGFSSSAFVELIKNSLPEHLKDQAQSFKLEMNDKFAVNPFDTPLGCRKPLAIDRDFLLNFVSLVLTPAGAQKPISRLSELVGILIDAMYEYFSDEQNPNLYEPGIDSVVDNALTDLSANFSDSMGVSWWEIVDYLFKNKREKEAALAQRHAVPTLNDATTVLTSTSSIKDIFGSAKNESEGLIDFLKGMIVSVVKDYPIISLPSVFDVGEARIVSMDLSSVAKSGSDSANKKTGVMYMLARQVLCREYYRNIDTLDEIPRRYREYHRIKIEAESETPKKIAMDEFHRTRSCQSVRDQATIDIREGRKFNVHISLLSQMIDDFDDAMVSLANNVYILSKGITEETVTSIEKRFGPSKDAIAALKRHVTGPGPEGSSMLYLGSLKGGVNSRVEQVIRLTLGPVEIWAYTTTHEDVHLRRKMVDKIGLNKSLIILAKEFPRGAKDYIKSLGLDDSEMDETYESSDNVYDKLSKELIKKYRTYVEAV